MGESSDRGIEWTLREMRDVDLDRLLDLADGTTPELLRNRALLEVVYASRMKLWELCALQVDDLDLQRQTLSVWRASGSMAMVVPVAERAWGWFDEYFHLGRPKLVTGPDLGWIFVNDGGQAVEPEWIRRLVHSYLDAIGYRIEPVRACTGRCRVEVIVNCDCGTAHVRQHGQRRAESA